MLAKNWVNQLLKNWVYPDVAVFAFSILLLVGVWGGTYWQIESDRRITITSVIQEGADFNRVLEEHVRRVLDTNSSNLNFIKAEYENSQTVTPAMLRFVGQIGQDLMVNQFAVIDADGKIISSLVSYPDNLNFSHMAHFQAQAGKDTKQIFIGQPFVGRVTQKNSIPLSVRLNRPDGSFAGIAYIALNPNYFSNFYQSIKNSKYYNIHIIGQDQVIRADSENDAANDHMFQTKLFQEAGQKSVGFYYTDPAVSGNELGQSYRVMPDYPLIIQVGITKAALQPLVQRRRISLGAASVVSLFIVIYGGGLIVRTRRLRQSEAQLQHNYEALTATHEELSATEEELRVQYEEVLRVNGQVLEQNALLSVLQETAFNLIKELDIDQLLHTIAARAGAMVDADEAYLALPDADGCLAVYSGFGGPPRMVITEGLIGKVYASGQSMVINDYQNWEGSIREEYAAKLSAVFVAPLKGKQQIVGVLGVAFFQQGRTFSKEQVALLERFADLASLALQNATLHASLQQELKARIDSETTLNEILDSIPDAIFVLDSGGSVLEYKKSPDFEPYFIFDQTIRGRQLTELFPRDVAGNYLAAIRQTLATGVTQYYEYSIPINGAVCFRESRFKKFGLDQVLTMVRDTTDIRRSQDQVEYLSFYDALTNVYNRGYFEAKMRQISLASDGGIAIMMCDVDGLKLINDALGHSAGDEVLRIVAGILGSVAVFGEDVLARVGGDEFAIIVHEPQKQQMDAMTEKIQIQIAEYNRTNPQLPVSLSTGWAADYQTGRNAEEIFKQADHDMYRQKIHRGQSSRSAIVQTMMKALEARDYITEGHAERLQDLAVALGRKLNLSRAQMADLRLFAKFHDIGKVGIPDSVLNKPGKLTEEEVTIMRRHCEIGFRIAQASPDLAPIADWILKHQEWWNGQGYPLGLSGEDIPLACRILALADAFDAMTNDRPYRQAMTQREAITELERCAGSQFDPSLAQLFVDLLREDESFSEYAAKPH